MTAKRIELVSVPGTPWTQTVRQALAGEEHHHIRVTIDGREVPQQIIDLCRHRNNDVKPDPSFRPPVAARPTQRVASIQTFATQEK